MHIREILVCLSSVNLCCLSVSAKLTNGNGNTVDETQTAGGNIEKLILNNRGTLLAFFFDRSFLTSSTEIRQLDAFLGEYTKTIEIAKLYSVDLLKVDCAQTKYLHYCDSHLANKKVFVFRNSNELVGLDLDTMFDVNSILANILQLALLKDVPILQTEDDLFNFVAECRSHGSEAVVAYISAIGIREHRIFMEVAFTYNDRYKFAISTEADVFKSISSESDMNQDCVIWHVEMYEDLDNYRRYTGTIDLEHFSSFLYKLNIPAEEEATMEIARENPFIHGHKNVFFWIYDEKSQESMKKGVQSVIPEYRGNIRIIKVHVLLLHELPFSFSDAVVPYVVFWSSDEPDPMVMPNGFNPTEFIHQCMQGNHDVFKPKAAHDVASSSLDFQRGETGDEKDGHGGHSLHHGRNLQDEVDTVLTEDDPVVIAAVEVKKADNFSHEDVDFLTDKTFNSSVEKSYTLVLFYLPYDPVSTVFLLSYQQASHLLVSQGLPQLAAVNCFDWTDVCAQEGVFVYPSVRSYRAGRHRQYSGMLSEKAIISTVQLNLLDMPVELKSSEDVTNFAEMKVLPGIEDYTAITSVGVLGVFPPQAKEQQAFNKMVENLQDQFVFAFSTSKTAKLGSEAQEIEAPALFVFRNDDNQPTVAHVAHWNFNDFTSFIAKHSIKTVEELTTASLPRLISMKRPLVILFIDDPQSTAYITFQTACSHPDRPDLSCVWIKRDDQIAPSLLEAYKVVDSEGPVVVWVNKEKGQVYAFPGTVQEPKDLIKFFKDVNKEQLQAQADLVHKEWGPRQRAFKFLEESYQNDSPLHHSDFQYDAGVPASAKEAEIRSRMMVTKSRLPTTQNRHKTYDEL